MQKNKPAGVSKTTIPDTGLFITNPATPLFVETFLIDRNGLITHSKGFNLILFGHKHVDTAGCSVFDLFREDIPLLNTIKQALNGEPTTIEKTINGVN